MILHNAHIAIGFVDQLLVVTAYPVKTRTDP